MREDAMPQVVSAIKFDPFVGVTNKKYTLDERIAFWQEKGIDAVFTIVHHRQGTVLFPTQNLSLDVKYPHIYPQMSLWGEADALQTLIDGTKARGMYLSLGWWMFRDDAAFALFPQWRQKRADGTDSTEQLLCARSPYMELEFYPMVRHLYEQYGMKDFFLQEMWLEGGSPLGGRGCFCDHCMELFNAQMGKNWTREELVAAARADSAVLKAWQQFQYESLKNVVLRMEEIAPGGTVLWHNPSPACEWDYLVNDPAFLQSHRISDMSLFPDEQIFVRGNTNVIDAYLEYAHVRRYVERFGSEGMTLEFLSLYGMAGISRKITRADILNCYLAGRAAGIPGFIAEQDKMLDWAEERGGQGIWDALGVCYSVLQPMFQNSAYGGTLENAPVTCQGEGAYGGFWTREDGMQLVIIGNRADCSPVQYQFSQPVYSWETKEKISNSGEIEACTVQLFLVKE